MPTETTNLFLLEDLEDVGRTSALAASDLDALRAVADWIKTFVALPNKDLGRSGPVCPFVPEALERKTLMACCRADRRPERCRSGRADHRVPESVLGRSTP
jgi:Domain of unknown function (DUF6875)